MPTRGLTIGEREILKFVFGDTLIPYPQITTNDANRGGEDNSITYPIPRITPRRSGSLILAPQPRKPGPSFTNSGMSGSSGTPRTRSAGGSKTS